MNAPSQAPVLLMVAAYLPSMRAMPRRFLAARLAERALRGVPGCALVHRWVSRRSILLTSWWSDAGAAQRALEAPPVRGFLDLVRASPGARVWTAVYILAPRDGHRT